MVHSRNSVRGALEDDVFASADLPVAVPKYRFPNDEQVPRHAYRVVHVDKHGTKESLTPDEARASTADHG
ncbi:hypothetical protein [Nocardioides sp. zg-1228]|uniref:hypothetical protein n=1 Tax=Nocardioides sp. zg-1228 TaxID=2763008 RepID=UPI001642E773|nr:hypothetical protein [Nocardioides sp. zg-1228]MBC2933736.1 hypothetical protein [Nocardioides sp. zg-1228]QSF58516.1 hypothetical protein JX575_04760 [Nocardioides sp. zg-1228]